MGKAADTDRLTLLRQPDIEEGSPGVPDVLRKAIATTLHPARSAAPATLARRADAGSDRG